MYDHQLSPRIGQRAPVESVPIPKIADVSGRPEAPHDGAMVFRVDVNKFEIYDDATEQWITSGTDPLDRAIVGEIKMWLTGIIPFGYLLLDGREVLRSDYPALYALWGLTFGEFAPTFFAAPGSDDGLHFTLPDLRSRLPIGAGTFAALGDKDPVQEDFRTLQHAHGADFLDTNSAGGHTHGAGTLNAGGANDRATGGLIRATQTITGSTASDGAHTHNVTGSTAYSGVSALPYFAVNFIVKY